MIRFSV